MAPQPDLFPEFSSRTLEVEEARIFARLGGAGPPLLLLHGYPQTHACWHRIAARLAERFTVVACDLPGYGDSRARQAASGPEVFSKRVMAADLVAAMRALGFDRFCLAGHDRGGRVAYRLALDHPPCVERLAVLSILPTFEMWRRLQDNAHALKAFRWFFLAQPGPLPRRLIEAAPLPYLHETLAGWTAGKDLSAFDPAALAAYETAFSRPEVIAAGCADYRAGWTADRLDDEGDLAAGRKIACPLLALCGRAEFPEAADVERAWRAIAEAVQVRMLDCGHFLPEEAPGETGAALADFLARG